LKFINLACCKIAYDFIVVDLIQGGSWEGSKCCSIKETKCNQNQEYKKQKKRKQGKGNVELEDYHHYFKLKKF
jgi:hypothetical protein